MRLCIYKCYSVYLCSIWWKGRGRPRWHSLLLVHHQHLQWMRRVFWSRFSVHVEDIRPDKAHSHRGFTMVLLRHLTPARKELWRVLTCTSKNICEHPMSKPLDVWKPSDDAGVASAVAPKHTVLEDYLSEVVCPPGPLPPPDAPGDDFSDAANLGD